MVCPLGMTFLFCHPSDTRQRGRLGVKKEYGTLFDLWMSGSGILGFQADSKGITNLENKGKVNIRLICANLVSMFSKIKKARAIRAYEYE